ncbi:hypothetical protein ABTM86_19350, partial [Acinetobacter baumannii]
MADEGESHPLAKTDCRLVQVCDLELENKNHRPLNSMNTERSWLTTLRIFFEHRNVHTAKNLDAIGTAFAEHC